MRSLRFCNSDCSNKTTFQVEHLFVCLTFLSVFPTHRKNCRPACLRPFLMFQKFFKQKSKSTPSQQKIPSVESGQASVDTSTSLSRHRDLGLQVLHEPKMFERAALQIVKIFFSKGQGVS